MFSNFYSDTPHVQIYLFPIARAIKILTDKAILYYRIITALLKYAILEDST